MIRYCIDFKLFPQMLNDMPAMVLRMIHHGGPDFFVNVFNSQYANANKTIFKDNPYVFTADQFKISRYAKNESQFVYCVELPGCDDGSMVHCEAYIFAFDIKSDGFVLAKLFTVEASIAGTNMLCSQSADGSRGNYGHVKGTMEENAKEVIRIAFKDEEPYEVKL